MSVMIKEILKDDWFVTATPTDMRVALMHLQTETMDRLSNQMHHRYKQVRQDARDACSEDLEWK